MIFLVFERSGSGFFFFFFVPFFVPFFLPFFFFGPALVTADAFKHQEAAELQRKCRLCGCWTTSLYKVYIKNVLLCIFSSDCTVSNNVTTFLTLLEPEIIFSYFFYRP